ncbi:hypothetical protein EBR66_08375 [bacterium]|jgi:hypothetical protein|nr:hypothetical protein [bacterium]
MTSEEKRRLRDQAIAAIVAMLNSDNGLTRLNELVVFPDPFNDVGTLASVIGVEMDDGYMKVTLKIHNDEVVV